MFSLIRLFLTSALFVAALSLHIAAQSDPPKKDEKSSLPTASKNGETNYTAEQIVESTIVIYAYPGGRQVLDQIRKTTFESGKTTILNSEGKRDTADYKKWIIRGGTLDKDKIRFEQKFPNVTYSMVQNNDKFLLMVGDTVYPPREDAALSFKDQIYRGLDGLLRYKENESTLELVGKKKEMGVDFYMIDVTDKQGRKTRYFISAKRFRVMMLDYEEGGKNYRRKFYDYNYAQGTLVPYRTVLYEDDKVIEETEVGTVTFGQKVDESLFPSAS